MTPDERPEDDPLLARVAAARPQVDEADLSPDGPRAEAILARVLATPRGEPAPVRPPRSAWWSRWRPSLPVAGVGGLGLAALAAVLVFVVVGVGGGAGHRAAPPAVEVHPLPAADAVHLDTHGHLTPKALATANRTPLGRVIARGYMAIQEDIDTGTPAQNRRAIEQLRFNAVACEQALTAAAFAPATREQRFIQYDWVRGLSMQAQMDRLLADGLEAFARGDRATGRRLENRADALSNPSIGFGAFALNEVTGDEGPPPRVPGIEGSVNSKWRGLPVRP